MAQKITHWLVVALIISLGFGQLLRFELFSTPVYLHDVLVVCILILQGQTLRVQKIYMRGLFLLGAGLFISSIRALTLYPLSLLLVPSLYMLRLLAYISLFILLKNSKIKIPKIYLILSGSVTLLIGLWQYFLIPDMRVFHYLGWDDHLSRLTLPHFDPTFTGIMLGLTLLIIPLKNWYLSMLLSFGLLLTYSRSVWISLVLTSMFFIKNKFILLATICFILLAIYALPKRFGEGTNLLRTYSISSRIYSDISYIQKYKWDLLIGHGMNTLILDTAPSEYENHATGPNNSYLYLLTTTGILGLVGWGIFMFNIYKYSLYKPALIFFFVASLFNNVMVYPFALLWIILLEFTDHKLQ